MVRYALYLLFALIFSIAPLNAAPADSGATFIGKWKLDPAHSRLTDQMKVESAGPNRYNLIFSADNVETIVADGTDQPALFGSTLAIVVQDASNWKIVRKSNGRTMIIGLWKLSPDGKTLTDDYTSYRENGTTMNLHYVYQRISDGSGFVGTWESTTEEMHTTYEIEVKPYMEDGLSFIDAAGAIIQNLRFDGRDYAGSGTNAPAGYVSSGHRIDARTVERVDKINGKTLYTQQINISADGGTLTMTVHIPGREKPNIMVFHRE